MSKLPILWQNIRLDRCSSSYLSKEDIQREEMQLVLPDWSLEPLKVYAIWPSNISTSSIAYTLINKIYNAFESYSL
jgi:hypothetical protein